MKTLFLVVTATLGGFLSCVSASSASAVTNLPGWLSHVDDELLDKYVKFAKERHSLAIKTALENYPTDDELPTDFLEEQRELIKRLQFDKFRISAHGKIPDFHEQLGDQPVFVTRRDTPLFTREECQEVIEMAESHFGDEEWPKLPSGQYYIQGFWIKDVPSVREWFVRMVKGRLFPLLKERFPDFVDSIEDLVVDQAYLFKYVPQPGLRTEIHTDAGCLSFTFSLNPKEDYDGGGTWVEGLTLVEGNEEESYEKNIIEMDVGQCTVRPGGIRHCGNPLTKGTRYIIGGFCMSKSRAETVRQLLSDGEKEGLECAIKLNPEFDGAYPGLARCYETEGDTEKAIRVLEDCLRLANPSSTTASYYLGTTYYKKDQFDKAAEHIKACLTVDPSDGDAMGTLAQIHSKLGEDEEEYEMYQRIIVTPGVSSRILSNTFCNLGTMNEGKDVEIEYYKKSLEYDPANVAALVSLGSGYASRKDWDNAIRCYRSVVESDNRETEEDVLTLLYRAATQKLRSEALSAGGQKQQSQQELMERLGQLMGAPNMEKLMSLRKGKN